MPNTEDSIYENGIPEISFDLSVSSVTTQPTDKTLKNDGQPADAKAVGDEIANVLLTVGEMDDEIDERIDGVDERLDGIDGQITTLSGNITTLGTNVQTNYVPKTMIDDTLSVDGDAAEVGAVLEAIEAAVDEAVETARQGMPQTVESQTADVNGNISLAALIATSAELQAMITDVLNGTETGTARDNANITAKTLRSALALYHAGLPSFYPKRKVFNVTIPMGSTSGAIEDAWITTDADCYAHNIDLITPVLNTTVDWTVSNGRVDFELGEAQLTRSITFQFAMIKGGV